MTEQEAPWYKEGLKFKCTGCGQCCTGSPGYVWVTEEEIQEMAAYLSLSVKDFCMRFIRKCGQRFALVEKRKTYDCIFLKDNKCTVYPVRPTMCQTFPFWPEYLTSKESWQEAGKRCEGVCESAQIVPFEEIETQKLIQLGGKRKVSLAQESENQSELTNDCSE